MVGIDWLRITMPFGFKNEITQRLVSLLGPATDKKGLWGYAVRHQLPHGAFVTFSDETRRCCIELPGTACDFLGTSKIIELAEWMMTHGGMPTRCDVCIDFLGQRLDLIDAVAAACQARQLCGARRWEAREPRTADGGYTGRGINLGARGKNGSGRYVRLYDKGLETKTQPARTWERWETEFTQDAAAQVVTHIIFARENWERVAMQLALGAVEFREHTGSRSLQRRPLAAWWSSLLEDLQPMRITLPHTPSNLTRHGSWLRRSVLPKLTAFATKSDQSLGDVATWFIGKRPLPPCDDPVVHEFLQAIEAMRNPNPNPAMQRIE